MVASKTPGATEIRVQLRPKLRVSNGNLGGGKPVKPTASSGFLEGAMGIEPRSKTRRLSPEPRKDSMAPVFVRSKNRNEVRQKTFVAGPIARSPSPSEGHRP